MNGNSEKGEGTMFERFTERARKVMDLANKEAHRFNHEYVGTEHILLGLVQEGSGVGANAIKNLGLELDKVRLEVKKLIKPGPDMLAMGKLPQTPRAKEVIDFAFEEARSFNHNYVGTEHILLGLLRESDGAAGEVLTNLGLKLEEIRKEVLNLLGARSDADPEEPVATKPKPAQKPRHYKSKIFRFSKEAPAENTAEKHINDFLQEIPVGKLISVTQSSPGDDWTVLTIIYIE